MGGVPELSFVVMTDYLFICYSFFRDLNHFRPLKTSHKLIPIRLYYHLFRYLSVWQKYPRWCEQTGDAMKMFFGFLFCFVLFFSFFFCSRHVSACPVRTTESVFPFTKQTATFVPARKYSQENAAKTVRKRLKRLLGALAGTTERTHLKVYFRGSTIISLYVP